jgi:two-component system, probable response regulator PhcQ
MEVKTAMQPRVLLVDDDPNVTQALLRTLRREAYLVDTANSPGQALGLLAENVYDVVVSDEQMPGMSGAMLLARIRQEHPETVRIILTGHANLEVALRAINDGHVYRFLTKPCAGEDLAVAIRQALQHRRLLIQSLRLLRLTRRQSDLIARLQDEYPGIAEVERDEEGAILIDEGSANPEELLRLMDSELEQAERRLSEPESEAG